MDSPSAPLDRACLRAFWLDSQPCHLSFFTLTVTVIFACPGNKKFQALDLPDNHGGDTLPPHPFPSLLEREAAREKGVLGPRCMIVGPQDSGKTSLCKILASYCARAGKGSSPFHCWLEATNHMRALFNSPPFTGRLGTDLGRP